METKMEAAKKEKAFEKELQEWMKKTLSPYCLNECKMNCCDCDGGAVQINPGYEKLFKTYKLTGAKVPIKKQNSKEGLFKSKYNDLWYFEGGSCPNYYAKNKKCLIHNKYPRCTLYPLIKTEKPKEGYTLFSLCSLHKLKENQEPLKSLIQLCKKHGFRLFKEKTRIT